MEHVASLPLASVKDTPLNSIVALLALILSLLVSELECAIGEMPIMVLIARLIKIVVVDAVTNLLAALLMLVSHEHCHS